MPRRVTVTILCAFALGLSPVGCGGTDAKDENPSNLQYGKDGPPPRDGVKGVAEKKVVEKKKKR